MKSLSMMAITYGLMWVFIGMAMYSTQNKLSVIAILSSLVAMLWLIVSIYFAADFLTGYWEIRKQMDRPVPAYELRS